MYYLVIAFMAISGQAPVYSSVAVPIQTKELCVAAAEEIRSDPQYERAHGRQPLTYCIRTENAHY